MDIILCVGGEVSPRSFLLGVENVFFLGKSYLVLAISVALTQMEIPSSSCSS